MKTTDSQVVFPAIVVTAGTLLLTAAGIASAAVYETPAALFLPVLILVTILAARHFLPSPIPVLAGFLLIIVNLDFLKITGKLTVDVGLSALLMWGLLIRGKLSGGIWGQRGVEKAYSVYLVVTLLAVLCSVSVPASMKRWSRDVEYFLLLGLLLHYGLTERDRSLLIKTVVLSSIAPCVIGLIGLKFHVPALLGAQAPVAEGIRVTRIESTLSHPVTLSLYIMVVSILTLSLFLDKKHFSRWITGPLFILQLIVLYYSYGRTGQVGFIAALAALFWVRGQQKVVFVGLPVGMAGLMLAIPEFWSRWKLVISEGGENSFLWRVGLWGYALRLFPERPLLGSGPGTFIDYVSYDKGYAAHQAWVGLLIETGILGTLAFLVLLIVLGRALWRVQPPHGGRPDSLLAAARAVFVGAVASSLAGGVFGLPSVTVYWWVLMALALGSSAHRGTPKVSSATAGGCGPSRER